MKKILLFFMALTVNALMGATLAGAVGINPLIGAVGLNGGAIAVSQLDLVGSMRVGVYTEVWTGEMIKSLSQLG